MTKPADGAAGRVALLLAGVVALLVMALVSVMVGARPMSVTTAVDAMTGIGHGSDRVVVHDLRIPRTVTGVLVGAAFGVAGALIQALTRNPLADAGVLGVNAGAGFAVTLGAGLFGRYDVGGYVWLAFAGALVTTVAVHALGAAGGSHADPVRLVLAGVALTAVLSGLSTVLSLLDPATFRALRNWQLGSIARTGVDDIRGVTGFLVVGLALAVVVSGALNTIALGDDLARSLGTNLALVRGAGLVAVALLAGGATALTGGIAFVGLMVPHVVRWAVGPDQRWILALSTVAAPVFVLGADVLGRVVARPGEIEVGIVAAVIGGPVLVLLVRRRRVSGL